MTNYDIVKKLIGNINPVGATHIDNGRLKNLEEMGELAVEIVSAIDSVAYDNKDSHEFSRIKARKLADNILDRLGIKE